MSRRCRTILRGLRSYRESGSNTRLWCKATTIRYFSRTPRVATAVRQRRFIIRTVNAVAHRASLACRPIQATLSPGDISESNYNGAQGSLLAVPVRHRRPAELTAVLAQGLEVVSATSSLPGIQKPSAEWLGWTQC